MRERLQQLQQMVERAQGHIMSPAEEALLDICAALVTEVAMLDAEVSLIESGEGPTGCMDDGDRLGQALRGMSQQDITRILDEMKKPSS